MPAGRKSLKEEIQIIRFLTQLSQPTFDYLNAMYLAGEKEDKKWAVEQMMKLYSKCIPTEIATDPENPLIITIAKSIADKNDTNPISEPNSGEQSEVQSS